MPSDLRDDAGMRLFFGKRKNSACFAAGAGGHAAYNGIAPLRDSGFTLNPVIPLAFRMVDHIGKRVQKEI